MAVTIFKTHKINGLVAFDRKAFEKACAKHNRFVIEVRRYDEAKEISRQQMAYCHAVVFPALAEFMGVSNLIAEIILKKKAGEQWFIKKVDGNEIILSKTMLTTKQTTKWLENMWDFMETIGCPVPPPDKDWRLSPPDPDLRK